MSVIINSLLSSQKISSAFLRVRSFILANAAHSDTVTETFKKMDVTIMPAMSDNYMYLIVDKETKEAAVVDPYDADAVVKEVARTGVNLTTVLTTHHHADHAGGNARLVTQMKGKDITVVGGDKRVNAVTKTVRDNEEFKIGQLNVKCMHTPCHTTGHICYYVTAPNAEPAVFTGDTLFVAGCGRFFEGTADMMYKSLIEKLGSLPDNTKVFCGHEYTASNLKFAATVEPDNKDIQEKLQRVTKLREEKKPTVPSTMGDEKKINPFMRVAEKSVQSYSKKTDPISTMAYVRQQKDSFAG